MLLLLSGNITISFYNLCFKIFIPGYLFPNLLMLILKISGFNFLFDWGFKVIFFNLDMVALLPSFLPEVQCYKIPVFYELPANSVSAVLGQPSVDPMIKIGMACCLNLMPWAVSD